MDNLPSSNSGQALLIVLLSMAVILTIVLSILSRSVTDIAVTSREEEALRAFSAAEAGIERAFLIGSNEGSFGDASFVATAINFAVSVEEYVYPEKLLSGESATVWFVDHDEETGELTCDTNQCFTGSQMAVCWAESGTPPEQAAALEISIFYTDVPWDYSTLKVARLTADPDTTRRTNNSFGDTDGAGCTLGEESQDFEFRKTVDFSASGLDIPHSLPGNLLLAKVRFFYNDETQILGFDVTGSGSNLPSQGRKIISTGTAGEANRKIEVLRTFGELPPIFGAAVFSPGGLVK